MGLYNSPARTTRILLTFALLLGFTCPLQAQQGPIHFVMDCHCDPIVNDMTPMQKRDMYLLWTDNLNWLLDQVEPLGAKISFLSAGQWMELSCLDGPDGPGAEVIKRLYLNGGQIGAHSHLEIRAGELDWSQLDPPVSKAENFQIWKDNIEWVNKGIQTAFPDGLPEPLSEINCVRGAHMSKDDGEGFHKLMELFGYRIREPGVDQEYYKYFRHYIWNPFRPSPDDDLVEDLDAYFAHLTSGLTIGRAEDHYHVFQDMTAPAARVQFLMLYLNWRYRDRTGAPEKVWTWGWSGHPHNFNASSPSRIDMVDFLAWLELHFVHRTEPTGSKTMTFDTHRGAAQAYFDWEAAHPGASSFSFESGTVDWDGYPYLRAVCEELDGFHWESDLDLGTGVEAYSLVKIPDKAEKAVLLWSESLTTTLDLSAHVGTEVRVVNLETGLLLGTDPAAVPLGVEPVLVTEQLAKISVSGSPGIGEELTLTVHGEAGLQAAILFSLGPADQNIPHHGRLQIDISDFFQILYTGTIDSEGMFSRPFKIPNHPGLVDKQIYFQGAVLTFDGHSPKLTVNAECVTITS